MESSFLKLNDRFRSLLATDSPMQQEWSNFETLTRTIQSLSHDLAVRASGFRSLPEVEAAVQVGESQMGQLFLETLAFLWNRLMLRTCLKVSDSLELMFFSMNTANAYGCTIAARSVIEHVAMLQYFPTTYLGESRKPLIMKLWWSSPTEYSLLFKAPRSTGTSCSRAMCD
jgi:hypothetical protein